MRDEYSAGCLTFATGLRSIQVSICKPVMPGKQSAGLLASVVCPVCRCVQRGQVLSAISQLLASQTGGIDAVITLSNANLQQHGFQDPSAQSLVNSGFA